MRFITIEKKLKKEFMDRGWNNPHDFLIFRMVSEFLKKEFKLK